ncbi:hypothetical protein BD413DRAFT_564638 [Trametes elegans]|nr:hypothetical protein BD413DRAFT_564638 [Trametes elegans]
MSRRGLVRQVRRIPAAPCSLRTPYTPQRVARTRSRFPGFSPHARSPEILRRRALRQYGGCVLRSPMGADPSARCSTVAFESARARRARLGVCVVHMHLEWKQGASLRPSLDAMVSPSATEVEAEIVQLVQVMHDTFVANLCTAAAAAWLSYDVLLTFSQEVALIWRARWSAPKALFLLVRYYTLVSLLLTLAVNTNHRVTSEL